MKKISLLIIVVMFLMLNACAPKININTSVDTNNSNSTMIKDVLDEVKNVHPGTAGNSLKSLIVIKDIMRLSQSNEYIDAAIQKYVNKLNKEELVDFSDSAKLVCQRFTDIDEDDINAIFNDEGIDLEGKEFSKSDYDYADKFLESLSDIAIRDFNND